LLLSRGDRGDLCPSTRYGHSHCHLHIDSRRIGHCNTEHHPLDRNRHGFAHTNFDPQSHADFKADGYPHPIPSADFYFHALTHLDEHADLYTSADIDFYADLYGDPVPNLHVYFDSLFDTGAHQHLRPHCDSIPNAMTDILPFLKSLIGVSGLSSHERPVAQLIEEKWKPLVDEISISRLGSLHALRRGRGKGRHPSIMIATHMDAIGLMVTQIVDGLIHMDEIGGIDSRILPGTPVIVHGRQDLPGVVVIPPMKTLPENARDKAIGLPHLLVDVGLLPSKVAGLVRVGDLVSYGTQPLELSGEVLSGHSLDNRASVAALTICLEELQARSHTWNVWAVATAQEEETLGGAATSAFHLNPDLAIAIDVTFARGPGANGWETFPMGKGPTLGWGANLHPFLFKKFKELAERLEIPVATELTPAQSGTDAIAIQVARDGIPTMLLGIPLRYMHTPVEMIAIKDVQRVGRLLSEFISGLEADFVSKITWEDQDAK
jgi:putative aminopeptidase FrvX